MEDSHDPFDDALRAVFEPEADASVLERIERRTGVRSRLLLHDAPEEAPSPLLSVRLRSGADEIDPDVEVDLGLLVLDLPPGHAMPTRVDVVDASVFVPVGEAEGGGGGRS